MRLQFPTLGTLLILFNTSLITVLIMNDLLNMRFFISRNSLTSLAFVDLIKRLLMSPLKKGIKQEL